MATSTFRIAALVLAAYVMAVLAPAFAMGTNAAQSPVEHARMMAMAGHPASMDGAGDDGQPQLCQQHCLFGAAALPPANPTATAVARIADPALGIGLAVASRAIPPPGPPPRVLVI